MGFQRARQGLEYRQLGTAQLDRTSTSCDDIIAGTEKTKSKPTASQGCLLGGRRKFGSLH